MTWAGEDRLVGGPERQSGAPTWFVMGLALLCLTAGLAVCSPGLSLLGLFDANLVPEASRYRGLAPSGWLCVLVFECIGDFCEL